MGVIGPRRAAIVFSRASMWLSTGLSVGVLNPTLFSVHARVRLGLRVRVSVRFTVSLKKIKKILKNNNEIRAPSS